MRHRRSRSRSRERRRQSPRSRSQERRDREKERERRQKGLPPIKNNTLSGKQGHFECYSLQPSPDYAHLPTVKYAKHIVYLSFSVQYNSMGGSAG